MSKSKEFYKVLDRIRSKEKPLSYSALSAFLKSPRHYFRYITEKETTEAMEKGKRFHMAILEPEEFKSKYWILDDSEKIAELLRDGYYDSKGKHTIPTSPRAVKPYKDWKAVQIAINSDKELIEQKEFDTYQAMIEVLKNHSVCKDLLFGEGENEKGFKFDDDVFKIGGKIDRATKTFTADLKKVADASYKKVKWDIERMNYDLQGVIYSKANKTSKHFIIYIDEGCNVTVVEVSTDTLIRFEEKYTNALIDFERCMESDSWSMSYDYWQSTVII